MPTTHESVFELSSLADNVGMVDTCDFCNKVEQDTRKEEGNPLGEPCLFRNPIHRQEEDTDYESFKKDVHLLLNNFKKRICASEI